MTEHEAQNSFWLPFTPNRDFRAEPKLFSRAKGHYYYTPDGRKIFDGASGLFTTPAGHGREKIADAVREQLLELDFVSSFQRSHPLAFKAAARVAALTPAGLNKIFFANSGSEAVDTAMKIALGYWRAKGEAQRTIFVSRERAYHGVGFGGVALSGLVNNRRTFGPGLPHVVHMRHTHQPDSPFVIGEAEKGAGCADDLERLAALHGPENIAACIVEPIAGSTGTLVPPKNYLKRLREICDRHKILLIFDEVITGFGRTGHAFAAQSFGVRPDMIIMAKAITNGVQPMSAVAADDKIFDAIVEHSPNPRESNEFFHGYTWSAHPAACAAAIAAIDIYRDENLFERARQMSAYFLECLFSLQNIAIVKDIRGYGMIGGLDVAPSAIPGARGHALQKQLYDNGLHIKTTGDSAVIAPPFAISAQEVESMVEIFDKTLRAF